MFATLYDHNCFKVPWTPAEVCHQSGVSLINKGINGPETKRMVSSKHLQDNVVCLYRLLLQSLSDRTFSRLALRAKDTLQSFSMKVSGLEELMCHTAEKEVSC